MAISPYPELAGYAALDLQMSEPGQAFLEAAVRGEIDTVQKLLKRQHFGRIPWKGFSRGSPTR